MTLPSPIRAIPDFLCQRVQMLFTDIDDTITENGLLPTSTFESLWALREAGIEAAVVTGRPAGWCDHIARMWPVVGVIGENGAFTYSYDRQARKMRRTYLIPEADRLEGSRRLERVRERVLKEVPGCAISADQGFRMADLAIDYREDVGPLSKEQIEEICRIIESEGATYKISSIHINCWYGTFDKVSGVRRFLAELGRELDLPEVKESVLFIGDSPNDEPMFKELKTSIAVANIRPYLNGLQHPPAYITDRPAATGFAEAVGIILAKRGRSPAPRPAGETPGPRKAGTRKEPDR